MRQTDRELISQLLKETRQKHSLTQAEVAKILGLSQPKYSDLEQGKGSLSAEVFLYFMRQYGLSFDYFNESSEKSAKDQIKLSLNKWGAHYIGTPEGGLIHTNLYNLYATINEVLVGYTEQKYICSLAPILVLNRHMINFDALAMKLYDLGLDGRIWWLVESVLWAVRDRLKWFISRSVKDMYEETEQMLNIRLKAANAFFSIRKAYPTDILDSNIKTNRVLESVRSERDTMASKWRLITRIKSEHFSEALKVWEEKY